MSIETLSSEVVDQIAAGEVVERPAHLIKELIENSLDAGARRIDVEFHSGGREVRVVDDGRGILKEDLPRALARHATSKISQAKDLWHLKSYGFRGEALASIASVSEMELRSLAKGAQEAFSIKSRFGQLESPQPTGAQVGTEVVVRQLFENIPARLKFLKSEAAESTQIKRVLKALALSSPGIRLNVRYKGKRLFFWPEGNSPIERAQIVLDEPELFFHEKEENGIKVKVAFSSPQKTVGHSRQIWLFCQNRWIQDRSLQAAVMEGYRSLLMHGEYPTCVVWLELPSEEVDVNVHPTKSQVRFLNPSQVFRAVVHTLREGLEASPWHKKEKNNLVSEASKSEENFSLKEPSFQITQYPQRFFSQAPSLESLQGVSYKEALEKSSEGLKEASGYWSHLQVLGQAHLTYIVAQNEEKMVLVDQHAAHERIAYEKLMKMWSEGAVDVQTYLIPKTFNMEEDGVEAVLKAKTSLEDFGVHVEQMGPDQLAVSAAPLLVKAAALEKAFKKLAEEILQQGESFAFDKIVRDLSATMACHSVIRAGQALSFEQMQSLLSQMDEFPFSSFCPHGRPVSIEYSFHQLEKEFGRIV